MRCWIAQRTIHLDINDLHSHLCGDEDTQDELGFPLVLLTPFYISTDHNGQTFRSQVLELLPLYIEVVERLAECFDARLVRSKIK